MRDTCTREPDAVGNDRLGLTRVGPTGANESQWGANELGCPLGRGKRIAVGLAFGEAANLFSGHRTGYRRRWVDNDGSIFAFHCGASGFIHGGSVAACSTSLCGRPPLQTLEFLLSFVLFPRLTPLCSGNIIDTFVWLRLLAECASTGAHAVCKHRLTRHASSCTLVGVAAVPPSQIRCTL